MFSLINAVRRAYLHRIDRNKKIIIKGGVQILGQRLLHTYLIKRDNMLEYRSLWIREGAFKGQFFLEVVNVLINARLILLTNPSYKSFISKSAGISLENQTYLWLKKSVEKRREGVEYLFGKSGSWSEFSK